MASGHTICRESEPATRIYVVLSGLVKVSMAPAGHPVVRDVLGAADVLGATAVFTDGHFSETATGLTLVRLAWVPAALVRGAAERSPALVAGWLQALAQQVRVRDAALCDMASADVTGRVARCIVMLAQRHGEDRPDGAVHLAHGLTRREFGQLVGAGVETVSRVLAQFVERGWIITGEGELDVLDAVSLRRRALIGRVAPTAATTRGPQ
ncbi:hypothetical protein BCA37_17100 [Mycobacterium sp. djl-10]|nr:hypothetical protein BCA37_17100 [Mycobacterium sp. djl-10]